MDEFEELGGEFPDIHALFLHYNDLYFNGVLLGNTTVEWSSKRMTLCGGICKYHPLSGCQIKLSEPLLKLRPVRDLKMVLLHEMIHAHNMTQRIRDPDPGGHGPPFLELMNKINRSTVPDPQRPPDGYKITTTHSMHGEVDNYRTHWWECERCKKVIKRAMNRPPQEADCVGRTGSRGAACCDPKCGYHTHLRTCGGAYIKVREPEPKPKASRKTSPAKKQHLSQHQPQHKPAVLPGQKRIDDIVRGAKRRAEGQQEPTLELGAATRGAGTSKAGSSIGGGGASGGRQGLHVQTGPLPGLWQSQRVPTLPQQQAGQDPKPLTCESVPTPVRQGGGVGTFFEGRAAGGSVNDCQQGVLTSPSAGVSASPQLPTAATHSKRPWPAIPARRLPKPAWGLGAIAVGSGLSGPSATAVGAGDAAGPGPCAGNGASTGTGTGPGGVPGQSAIGGGSGPNAGSVPGLVGLADREELATGQLESDQLASSSGSGLGSEPMLGGSRMGTEPGPTCAGIGGGAEAPSVEELRRRCAEAALARFRSNGQMQQQPQQQQQSQLVRNHGAAGNKPQEELPASAARTSLSGLGSWRPVGRGAGAGEHGLKDNEQLRGRRIGGGTAEQVIHAILDSDEDKLVEANESHQEEETEELGTADARGGAKGRMFMRTETGWKAQIDITRQLKGSVTHVASHGWPQGLTRPSSRVQQGDISVEVVDLVDDESDIE